MGPSRGSRRCSTTTRSLSGCCGAGDGAWGSPRPSASPTRQSDGWWSSPSSASSGPAPSTTRCAHELINSILELIEKAKQELVSPDQYAKWADTHLAAAATPVQQELLLRHRECAEVYRRLEERFLGRAILDHDDTILYAEKLIREDPDVHDAVAGSLDHVMVDEYQDTNYAQARLVEGLAGERGNLLVVADDDQSIYKFRGHRWPTSSVLPASTHRTAGLC